MIPLLGCCLDERSVPCCAAYARKQDLPQGSETGAFLAYISGVLLWAIGRQENIDDTLQQTSTGSLRDDLEVFPEPSR